MIILEKTMGFFRKKLTDDEIIAVVKTAMETLIMETELLQFPTLCFDWKLVPTEAYYRGLLEGFVIGIIAKHKYIKITDVNTDFSSAQLISKNKKTYDDAITKCSYFGAFIGGDYAAFYWTTCYQFSDLEISKELFSQRLSTAKIQEPIAYSLGKSDAFYQVSIAHTGMLEPTKNLQYHIDKITQSRLETDII